jgi:hypothetical protein
MSYFTQVVQELTAAATVDDAEQFQRCLEAQPESEDYSTIFYTAANICAAGGEKRYLIGDRPAVKCFAILTTMALAEATADSLKIEACVRALQAAYRLHPKVFLPWVVDLPPAFLAVMDWTFIFSTFTVNNSEARNAIILWVFNLRTQGRWLTNPSVILLSATNDDWWAAWLSHQVSNRSIDPFDPLDVSRGFRDQCQSQRTKILSRGLDLNGQQLDMMIGCF